jgi:hypothetical protein
VHPVQSESTLEDILEKKHENPDGTDPRTNRPDATMPPDIVAQRRHFEE